MSMTDDIKKLNQIVSIVDKKANQYKNDRHHMPRIQASAEKKLILDLINDGLELARSIGPQAQGLIQDLDRLKKEFIKF